jgi:hypothetical protein
MLFLSIDVVSVLNRISSFFPNPSVNPASILSQILLAACLGAGFLVIIYWHKVKRFMQRFDSHNPVEKHKS